MPQCRDGGTVAVGRSALDVSLGRQYLRLDVRNCTSRPVLLIRPVVRGANSTTLKVVPTSVSGRPEPRFMLGAGRTASAGLSWRTELRDGRIPEVRIAVAGSDRPAVLPLSPPQLRSMTRLDYYPWVSRPDKVFGN